MNDLRTTPQGVKVTRQAFRQFSQSIERRRKKANSPIEPESSTNMTVSNKANLARSIAISIGMFH